MRVRRSLLQMECKDLPDILLLNKPALLNWQVAVAAICNPSHKSLHLLTVMYRKPPLTATCQHPTTS